MAKSKNNDVIKPVMVESISMSEAGKEITVPEGHALVIPLDKDGNEITAQYFFYPVKNVDRFYGDTSKFVIKKKNP